MLNQFQLSTSETISTQLFYMTTIGLKQGLNREIIASFTKQPRLAIEKNDVLRQCYLHCRNHLIHAQYFNNRIE